MSNRKIKDIILHMEEHRRWYIALDQNPHNFNGGVP